MSLKLSDPTGSQMPLELPAELRVSVCRSCSRYMVRNKLGPAINRQIEKYFRSGKLGRVHSMEPYPVCKECVGLLEQLEGVKL